MRVEVDYVAMYGQQQMSGMTDSLSETEKSKGLMINNKEWYFSISESVKWVQFRKILFILLTDLYHRVNVAAAPY